MFRRAGREERKQNDGTPCPACTLHLHHKDIIAYDDTEGTLYMHWQCAEVLTTADTDVQSTDVIPEDSPAAAEKPIPYDYWKDPNWVAPPCDIEDD